MENGDHPEDNPTRDDSTANGRHWEGEIVRYYQHPDVAPNKVCEECYYTMHDHGWIDTLEGGHRVCPGDYVTKSIQGEFYPIKPDIFEQTYEKINE